MIKTEVNKKHIASSVKRLLSIIRKNTTMTVNIKEIRQNEKVICPATAQRIRSFVLV